MRKILFAILLPAVFASCRPERPYIHGNIQELPDMEVSLFIYTDSLAPAGKTVSEKGRFTLSQPSGGGIGVLAFSDYPGYYLPVVFGGADLTVEGSDSYERRFAVRGDEANDKLTQFYETTRPYAVMLAYVEKGLASVSSNPADSAARTSLINKKDSLNRLIGGERVSFMKNNPSNPAAAMFAALSLTDSTSLAEVDSLLGFIGPDMPDNYFSRKLTRRRNELAR